MATFDQIQPVAREAAAEIRPELSTSPRVAVVLGSGLGDFAGTLSDTVTVAYHDIPHYPQPTVEGHAGEFVFGTYNELPLVCARGRFHYYEGYPLETVVLPVHLFAALGVDTVIITNAAGCVRKEWKVGELMLITGHLDYTFLDGKEDPDPVTIESCHPGTLLDLARGAARDEDILLREGIYTWTLGPTFETPAEIHDIRRLGGDAVGMSTVPEIRAAAGLGLRSLSISCLTNYAAGILDQPLNHEEVLETGQRVKTTFARLLQGILRRMAI